MKKPVRCFNCNRVFHVSEKKLKEVNYCSNCVKKYGYKALRLQQEFGGMHIEDLIFEGAKEFKRLDYVADSLGISYNTLIKWIRKFFLIDELQFRRVVVCKSPVCCIVKVKKEYRFKFIRKIKDRAPCYLPIKQKFFCVKLSDNDLRDLFKGLGSDFFVFIKN